MLALTYLVLLVLVGDTFARPLVAAVERVCPGAIDRPRRLATAFLVGLVVMTWFTYIIGLAARAVPDPLLIGERVTFIAAGLLLAGRLAWAWRQSHVAVPVWLTARPARAELLDWTLILALTVFAGWMASATYQFQAGELRMATFVWSDFGPTSAIAQSFALGDNFPTEYPHFAGFPILYHFLFYFQVGNLTRLGFDPALATNVLSVASLVAMVVLVIALGRVLFRSAAVGRLGAILFFVHGSLAYLPYLGTFGSPAEALAAVGARTAFLASGFPYRGEEWGIWTQAAFLNQRHLASAIGILLLAILFVLERAPDRSAAAASEPGRSPAEPTPADANPSGAQTADTAASPALPAQPAFDRQSAGPGSRWQGWRQQAREELPGYALAGVLLGLLPLWNSALFTASAVVFAVLFVFLPNRLPMLATAVAAGIVALPQILALRPAELPRTAEYPVIHFGYVIDNPTAAAVAAYLAVTFGPKLVLAGLAAATGTFRQWAVLLAFSTLVVIAFTLQFSVEVFANHKFLNVWLIVLNIYAAAGLLRLWEASAPGRWHLPTRGAGRGLAVAFAVVIAIGGLIDLAPIRNAQYVSFRLDGDRLFDWVRRETRPTDVFLSELHVTHPILLAGRRLYHGWPYYAWSAGYPVREREELFRQMVGGTDIEQVIGLLQHENIAYVAVDDGLRTRGFVPSLNEPLLAGRLEKVFDDPEGRYGHLAIYRVPGGPGLPSSGSPGAAPTPGPTQVPNLTPDPGAPTQQPVDMATGGPGTGPGRFAGPRGIAVAPSGEVLVADSDNHRIQRFSADGTWLGSIGSSGSQPGRFTQPNGVAVDSQGRIYVADTLNHRLQELDPNFTFASEWRGPAPGFYGPRDVTVGPGDVVYVLDQGRSRVASRAPDGTVRTFGSLGSGPGQLNDATGIAVAGDRVYVADTGNARIVVFSTTGQPIATLPIEEWRGVALNYSDVAVSADGRRLYVSSIATNEVLVMDADGRRLGKLSPTPANPLAGPAALATRPDGRVYVVNFVSLRVSLLATAS